MPDTSAKLKTREELEEEWWTRWNLEDFSWDALAKKMIKNGGRFGEKTLQDYWRRMPGSDGMEAVRSDQELIQLGLLLRGGDGRLWHIAHLDTRNATDEGLLARKSHFIWNEARARLTDASTPFDYKQPELEHAERDLRAQFQGVVFGALKIDFVNSSGPICASLRAEFAWIGCFQAEAQTFRDDFNVTSAAFGGPFIANRSRFLGSFLAEDAVFLDGFCGDKAEISGDTNFSDTSVLGSFLARETRFSGEFRAVSASFLGEVHFNSCTFCSLAHWSNAEFLEQAYFVKSHFKGQTHFVYAYFSAAAQFTLCTFDSHTSFEASNFEDVALFDFVRWPKSPKDLARCYEGTQFSGRASFERSEIVGFSAFGGVQFGRGALFDKQREDSLVEACKTEMAEIEAGVGRDFEQIESIQYQSSDRARILNAINVDIGNRSKALVSIKEYRLHHLERGCRAMKLGAGRDGDRSREQLFYRFELMVRSAQSTTPWQERCASAIYEVVSDYGTSITRPLNMLLLFWFLFSLAYVTLAHVANGGALLEGNLASSLGFSLNRTLQPLTWVTKTAWQENSVVVTLLGHQWAALCTQVLAALQSLISIILLFLSGLALRRRFQIN